MLLPELWLEILEHFNCQELLLLKLVSKYMLQLINQNNLYEKRKRRGYPRSNGCAENENLVRGDIVGNNIFDGHKMIPLKKIDGCYPGDYYELPDQFTINGIQKNYWDKINYLDSKKAWIDITSFRDQCLTNIKWRPSANCMTYISYEIETQFEDHGKNIVLFYMSDYIENEEETYTKFNHILTVEDKVYVEWDNTDEDFLIDNRYNYKKY